MRYQFRHANGGTCCDSDDLGLLCGNCRARALGVTPTSRPAVLRTADLDAAHRALKNLSVNELVALIAEATGEHPARVHQRLFARGRTVMEATALRCLVDPSRERAFSNPAPDVPPPPSLRDAIRADRSAA